MEYHYIWANNNSDVHTMVKHYDLKSPQPIMSPESGNCLIMFQSGSKLSDWCGAGIVAGSVKMIRFSYSNEDTKDEEGREGCRPEMPLSRCHAPSLNHTSPLSRNAPQQGARPYMRDVCLYLRHML